MLPSVAFRPLPDPWHSVLISSGYVLEGDRQYVCYYRLLTTIAELWRHPYFELHGPRHAPAQIALLAPHLVHSSRLLTRLLAGEASPLCDRPNRQARREERWWSKYFAGHDLSGAVTVAADRILIQLDQMLPDQQQLLLAAAAALVIPKIQSPATSWDLFRCIQVVERRDGVVDVYANTLQGPLGYIRETGLPIDRLFTFLDGLHSAVGVPLLASPPVNSPASGVLATRKE